MNSHGLTKENLLFAFPVALREDRSIVALGDVTAEALATRPQEIDQITLYPRISELPEDLLDILAYDFKVDWWDSNYTLDEKRRTLAGNWRVHKTLGTKAAVETAIRAIYPMTTVEEWFEYGGEPYHFRLNIDITSDSGDRVRQKRVLDRLNFYKSLRSHNDGVRYFLYPAKSWALAGGAYTGSRQVDHAAVKIPELKRPGGEVITIAGGALVGSWRRIKAEAKTPPVAKPGDTAEYPVLMKPGAGTQIGICWALGGLRQHIGASVSASGVEAPKGKARTAAQAGFYGSCQRASVTVHKRGGAGVPAGKGASFCSAGTFHAYQRMGVSIPVISRR